MEVYILGKFKGKTTMNNDQLADHLSLLDLLDVSYRIIGDKIAITHLGALE